MPRDPDLPIIDWNEVLTTGTDWEGWLAIAEKPERAQKMADDAATVAVPAPVAAALRAIPNPVHVVVIAEDWCGDVHRHVPVLRALAVASQGAVTLAFHTRHSGANVFVRHLTNGGEAIPRFVFLSDRKVECASWGPMVSDCKTIIARGKACGDVGTARKLVSRRYQADPERLEVIRELMACIDIAATSKLVAPPEPKPG